MRVRTLVVSCLVAPLVCVAVVVRALAVLPPIRKGVHKWRICYFANHEVARFDGIILSDCDFGPNHTSADFTRILLASLELLKATDPIRFSRVRRHLSWIVRRPHIERFEANYEHATRSCSVFFRSPSELYPEDYLIGWYACTVVHEATHGYIECCGVSYSRERRERIERICFEEEQRFVDRLSQSQPALAEQLRHKFDPAAWDWYWNATGLDRVSAAIPFIERVLFPKK